MCMKQLSLGYRNNNPLNIRFSVMNNWKGQTGSNKGFCVFDSLESGYRAALVLLCNYQRKGYDTVAKIISHWAPASENDTEAYINYVVKHIVDGTLRSVVEPDTRITDFEILAQVCWTMSKFETGIDCHFNNREEQAAYVSMLNAFISAKDLDLHKYPYLRR